MSLGRIFAAVAGVIIGYQLLKMLGFFCALILGIIFFVLYMIYGNN